MSPLDEVKILQGRRREDARGWLHVIMGASQMPDGIHFGELYVVRAEQRGDRRGDHYHPVMREWFSVVEGEADLELVDPETGDRRVIRLTHSDALTVHVPAGLAHCLVNVGDEALTVVAWATHEHRLDDVVSFSTDVVGYSRS